jgi:hypothetical protein
VFGARGADQIVQVQMAVWSVVRTCLEYSAFTLILAQMDVFDATPER